MKFVPTTPLINPPTEIRLAGRRTCEFVGLVYKTVLFNLKRKTRNFSAFHTGNFAIGDGGSRLPTKTIAADRHRPSRAKVIGCGTCDDHKGGARIGTAQVGVIA